MESAKSEEIELARLIRYLSGEKVKILGITGLFSILAIFYLQLAEFEFTCSLPIIPTAGQTGEMSSSLGGLASLAGISLPGSEGEDRFELYLEAVRSRGVADIIAEDDAIMTKIFESEWDKEAGQWKKPSGIVAFGKSLVYRILGKGRTWVAPDGAKLEKYIGKNVSVSKNRSNSLVTLTMLHKDPEIGLDLLQTIHETTDNLFREKALARANENVRYLNEKLATTSVAAYRESIFITLAEQEKVRMMASSNSSFVAEPFGEPYASPDPTNPRQIFTFLVFSVFGMFLGVLTSLVMSALGNITKMGSQAQS